MTSSAHSDDSRDAPGGDNRTDAGLQEAGRSGARASDGTARAAPGGQAEVRMMDMRELKSV
eukprot:3976486-Pyramimonas_sp.AAC.1